MTMRRVKEPEYIQKASYAQRFTTMLHMARFFRERVKLREEEEALDLANSLYEMMKTEKNLGLIHHSPGERK